MAMGLNSNTPSYIWKMEAGRGKMEIESVKRTGKYLGDMEYEGRKVAQKVFKGRTKEYKE